MEASHIEALVVALMELSLTVDSSASEKRERITSIVLESVKSSNKTAREASDASNNINLLDIKMDIASQPTTCPVNDDGKAKAKAKVNFNSTTMMNMTGFIRKDGFETGQEATRTMTFENNCEMNMESVNRQLALLKDEIKVNSAIMSRAVKDSNQEMNKKINRMNQHLTSLENDIVAVKTLLRAQDKQRRLEFQISCAELNSFIYYVRNTHVPGNRQIEYQSSGLVRRILKSYALGKRYTIEEGLTTHRWSDREEGRVDFHDKLKKQIAYIIGHEPRIVKVDDDWYDILFDFDS